ncbi:hypothetical protein QUA00_34085, partial [Microcoleus sp. T2B6]|uniref:hypothetical protein n=1 Tax=Microcoleus sp. T2B6 TaxID=3055424 RepID=UPI002FD5C31A
FRSEGEVGVVTLLSTLTPLTVRLVHASFTNAGKASNLLPFTPIATTYNLYDPQLRRASFVKKRLVRFVVMTQLLKIFKS